MSLSPIFLPRRSAPFRQKAHPPPYYSCSPLYKAGTYLSAIKSVFAFGKCLCLLSFCRGAPRLSGKKPTHHPYNVVAPCILVVLVCVPPFLFHSPPPRHLPRPRPLASKRESKLAGPWLRSFVGGWSCWLLWFSSLLLLLACRHAAFCRALGLRPQSA